MPRSPSYFLVSLGGIGGLGTGAGTWASAATLLAWLILHACNTPLTPGIMLLAGFTLTVAGTLATRAYLAQAGVPKDPSEVVIDECAGMCLALTFAEQSPYFSAIAAFAIFRFLDILKPGPIGWAESLPGAAGVMADDVCAGVIASFIALLPGVVGSSWVFGL